MAPRIHTVHRCEWRFFSALRSEEGVQRRNIAENENRANDLASKVAEGAYRGGSACATSGRD